MSSPHPRLVLASTSPRRRELLLQIGVAFDPVSVQVDETPLPGEAAEVYVARVAAEKSRQGQRAASAAMPVLGADTEVILEGKVLGKPQDLPHCLDMLRRLSGREHRVLSAVSLRLGECHWQSLSVSTVRFRELGDDEIHRYWETGEPRDKAGGYGIQGFGAVFISHLEGSFSGVMGLPLFETAGLLRHVGFNVLGNAHER